MAVTRRRFLTDSAVIGASVAASSLLDPAPTAKAAPPRQATTAATPSPEVIALHRIAYGPRPGDSARVRSIGLDAYIAEQLNPAAIDDSACETMIGQTQLKIRYAADSTGRYPAVSELRPLANLAKPIQEVWPLGKSQNAYAWQERLRPFHEVRVATLIRAVHSKRQLQEVLVDFWHNHFNVNAASDSAIASTFAVYDRIVRANCLGNFRTFLEEVAKSTAMMYYLDNLNNRTGGLEGGNENYTRELFELHTFGSDNYLKFIRDPLDRDKIQTDWGEFVNGYADDDVYEAARCFTGWTIKNGHWERPTLDDGSFYTDDTWHDGNVKIVLGKLISRNQGTLKDGQTILEALANHICTARFICRKLCRRLIADNPPQNVVDAAIKTWMDNRTAPDQLKLVVQTILASNEFRTVWGQKVKRPFEALAAFLRATNATLPVDQAAVQGDTNRGEYWGSLFYLMAETGHRIFEWGPPTGHPDISSYWSSTGSLLARWNLPYALKQSWAANITIDIVGQTNLNDSCVKIVDFWIDRLCGFAIDPATRQELIVFLAQSSSPTVQGQSPKPLRKAPDWNNADAVKERVEVMVQLLTMTPDFNAR